LRRTLEQYIVVEQQHAFRSGWQLAGVVDEQRA
jgi:hypothetical protein